MHLRGQDEVHTSSCLYRRLQTLLSLAALKPIGMLFQTGYLTIKDYSAGLYVLGVPDDEVRQDLNLLMAGLAADKDMSWAADLGADLRCCEAVLRGVASMVASAVMFSTGVISRLEFTHFLNDKMRFIPINKG